MTTYNVYLRGVHVGKVDGDTPTEALDCATERFTEPDASAVTVSPVDETVSKAMADFMASLSRADAAYAAAFAHSYYLTGDADAATERTEHRRKGVTKRRAAVLRRRLVPLVAHEKAVTR